MFESRFSRSLVAAISVFSVAVSSFPQAFATETASVSMNFKFEHVSGKNVMSALPSSECVEWGQVQIKDVATFGDRLYFVCWTNYPLFYNAKIFTTDQHFETPVEEITIPNDSFPGRTTDSYASWNLRFVKKDGTDLYFMKTYPNVGNTQVALKFFRLDTVSWTVEQIGDTLIGAHGNWGYFAATATFIFHEGVLYVPRIWTNQRLSQVDKYSVSGTSMTFMESVSVPWENYGQNVHVMTDGSIQVMVDQYDAPGTVNEFYGGTLIHAGMVTSIMDSIRYSDPAHATMVSITAPVAKFWNGFYDAVELDGAYLYRDETNRWFTYRKSGENRLLQEDGTYVSDEIELPELTASSYVKVDGTIPAGTSYSFEIATENTATVVLPAGNMAMFWMDNLDCSMDQASCGNKGASFQVGTNVIINEQTYVVSELMDWGSMGFRARLNDSSGNPAMLDWLDGKAVSVGSQNFTPVPTETLNGKVSIEFPAETSSVWFRIILSGDANDRSKTPVITKVSFHDSAVPDAVPPPEATWNGTINRSDVADAVLDALGLTDLVSWGRTHATGDEQKAKAEKYSQFLASPDFTAKVSATGNSKVLWVDLSNWNP